MTSKFIDKSAQKISIFASKANYARGLIFLVFFLKNFSLLFSIPDLTIVGYIKPEDGLGKIPITIVETLDNQLSINFIHTRHIHYIGIPDSMIRVLNHPDSTCGKIVLFTDVLAYNDWQPFRLIGNEGMIKLAYSMLETTRIPDSWVKILNEAFDAVIVPDESLVSVYEDSGVLIPIFVLPIPMVLKPYFEHPMHSESPSTPFTFLDASANKNPGVLIEAFAKAFGNSSAVRLILRAGLFHPEMRDIINRLIPQYGLTNVKIEERHLHITHMIERLASSDCYYSEHKIFLVY